MSTFIRITTSLTVLITLAVIGIVDVISTSTENEMSDERYNKGKEKYEALKRETQMPKYSQCWKNALKNLESGCKNLNDDIQHRLALEFSNCFLQKMGREIYPCSQIQDLEQCTRNMKPEAFNTYTEFFTHTQNICFFLQSQIWQEITENTVSKLSDNSESVARQLEDSGQLQSEILKKQNESIKNQEVLLERGRELSHTIQTSSVDIHHMLKEYKEATSEQRAVMLEVFDRLNSLQSVVMGEFTGFYSFIFYTLAVIVSYLLTSSPRTNGARFWLFAIMTVNVVMERVLVAYGVDDSHVRESLFADASAILYGRLWWCRQVSCGLAVFALAVFAYRYKDLNKINNQLLVEIRKQNSDLKKMFLCVQNVDKSTPNVLPVGNINANSLAEADRAVTPVCDDQEGSRRISSVSADSAVDLHESSDDDGSSDSSMASDHTFMYSHSESECSDSDLDVSDQNSFSRHSREGTPSMLDELRVLRASTPFMRQMTPIKEIAQSVFKVLGEKPPMSPGRPRGSKNTTPSSLKDDRPFTCRYNLRRRRPDVHKHNPALELETPEAFTKTIKNLSRLAQQNSIKTRLAVKNMNSPRFSSDDK